MSEAQDSASLQEQSSVAQKLKAAGFHQTGIARAVAELVGEYLGIHSDMGENLITALGRTNTAASGLLGEHPGDPREVKKSI